MYFGFAHKIKTPNESPCHDEPAWIKVVRLYSSLAAQSVISLDANAVCFVSTYV